MERKKTPTKKIESSKNPNLEIAYIKVPGKLIEPPQERYFHGTEILWEDVQKILDESDRKNYTSLHTHPTTKKKFVHYSPQSLPSDNDFKNFLHNPEEKTMMIAERNVNDSGILGYTIIRKTKKTPTKFSFNLLEDLNSYMRKQAFEDPNFIRKSLRKISGVVTSSSYDPEQEKFLKKRWEKDPKIYKKALEEFCGKYNLQHKNIPAKNHKPNGKNNPKSEYHKLESKVMGIIMLVSLITFFTFSNNLTGSVISQTFFENKSNILSVILIGLLVSGIIFYRRVLKNCFIKVFNE